MAYLVGCNMCVHVTLTLGITILSVMISICWYAYILEMERAADEVKMDKLKEV